jgi:hypothetical protein
MPPHATLIVVALLACPLVSCATEPNCTQEVRAGVVVHISGAFDGTPLAENARGTQLSVYLQRNF